MPAWAELAPAPYGQASAFSTACFSRAIIVREARRPGPSGMELSKWQAGPAGGLR
jgi:hypothetical protein